MIEKLKEAAAEAARRFEHSVQIELTPGGFLITMNAKDPFMRLRRIISYEAFEASHGNLLIISLRLMEEELATA